MAIFFIKDENKLIENFIVVATSLLVLILGLMNNINLWKKRNQFPFSNISPKNLFITFICKRYFFFKIALMIYHVIAVVSYIFYDEEIYLYLNLLNFFILHVIIWLLLLLR